MKVKPTPNGNIEATFKPHQKSEPVTVFLRPRIKDSYFSPTQHSGRHGRIDAVGVKRGYADHLKKLREVQHPTVVIDLLVSDTDDNSRRPEFGWDGNPSLIVRGQPVNNAEAQVQRYHHMEGDGYNHVYWSASSSLEGMLDSEKQALSEAFDKILLDSIPAIVPQLIKGRVKQAKEALREFIVECADEVKQLRAIEKEVKW